MNSGIDPCSTASRPRGRRLALLFALGTRVALGACVLQRRTATTASKAIVFLGDTYFGKGWQVDRVKEGKTNFLDASVNAFPSNVASADPNCGVAEGVGR